MKFRWNVPRNVLIVGFVALASGLGQDLITPILPGFLVLLGLSQASIGLIDGLLQGVTNVFRFLSGVLSDRFRDRKYMILAGYGLSSLARPLLALAGGFGLVAALRVTDGIGKGTKDAPRDALIADSVQNKTTGRAFGFHRLIDTAGSVIGPLLAGGLLLLLTPSLGTYRFIFALTLIPGVIALLLIWFGIREPSKKKATKKHALGGKLPSVFWAFTGITTLAMGLKINDSLFLVRAGEVGFSPAIIPIVFGGFTLIYAALSYPIGVWSDRFGKLPFIVLGWAFLSVVEVLFAFQPGVVGGLGLFAVYGLFYALTEGSGRAYIADIVPRESRGKAYGIFSTSVGLAVIVGGYGLGRLWDAFSPQPAFFLSAVASFASACLFAALLWRVRHANA